jgi:hypothetical protein
MDETILINYEVRFRVIEEDYTNKLAAPELAGKVLSVKGELNSRLF